MKIYTCIKDAFIEAFLVSYCSFFYFLEPFLQVLADSKFKEESMRDLCMRERERETERDRERETERETEREREREREGERNFI